MGFGGPPPPPGGGYYDASSGPVLAEWWQRLVARFIDGLLLGCVTSLTGLAQIKRVDTGNGLEWKVQGGGFLLTIVIGTLYYGLMHGLRGQTLGKMALGLKVVKKGTAEKIEMGPAFIRAIVEQLLAATCILGLLDGLWPLWDKDRQAIHDKVATSQVIKAR
jgi:uncharacterized RDD family membrane protein YckC